MSAGIRVFRCLSDNIGVLLHDEQTGTCVAIDAPEAGAIDRQLETAGWKLTHILVTHSHADHVQGIPELKQKFGCQVIVPEKAAAAVPDADSLVREGDSLDIGPFDVQVWETPGHCADHVSYILPSLQAAFVGDVLFTLGCGRVFGGDYEGMWRSISRLLALPDETLVYCGHDYTLSNGRFALAVDPENGRLQERIAEAQSLADKGSFLIPARLGDERVTNPFLRADKMVIARSVGKENATPLEVFRALREWKNNF